jgi:hypothetical protein
MGRASSTKRKNKKFIQNFGGHLGKGPLERPRRLKANTEPNLNETGREHESII